MKVVEAPLHVHTYSPDIKVFLAGGITGCPDWQKEFVGIMERELPKELSDKTILMNPRRENFPIEDPNAAKEQIEWEYDQLNSSDAIIYWFCKDTLNPIVLYELGFQLGKRMARRALTMPALLIGVEEGYERAQDVEIQTALVDDRISICSTLKELGYNLHKKIEEITARRSMSLASVVNMISTRSSVSDD